MKIIKLLSELISEEIKDAEKYANMALQYKEEYPEVAETFHELSAEEMQHMNDLHDMVTMLITKYRNEHGEPPEGMMAVYNYLHEKQVDDAMNVKARQMMFKAD